MLHVLHLYPNLSWTLGTLGVYLLGSAVSMAVVNIKQQYTTGRTEVSTCKGRCTHRSPLCSAMQEMIPSPPLPPSLGFITYVTLHS